MKNVCIVIFLLLSFLSNAQSQRYLKVSGGKTYFGTGDIPGYTIYTEYSFQLGKQRPASYWKHFQLGGELGFEAGTKQPKTLNPPPSDYLKGFYHTSNSFLYAKLTYYPIGGTTFLKGLNVAVGPTAGYTFASREGGWMISQQPDGNVVRASYLDYNNKAFAGYRISISYEYAARKILFGIRTDWSNNLNGDMNIMYGAKIGWKL